MDWKNVGVPLITAVLVVLFGGTAVINYIVSAFLVPDVNVKLLNNPNDKHSVYVSVTNLGRVSAKDMTITINNPAKILNHTIFSTEEYTENKNYSITHPNILKIFIPRFVQGEGSLVNITLKVDSKANIDSSEYVVYTTYEQGSVKKILPVAEKGAAQVPPSDLISALDKAWNFVGGGYIGVVYAIIAGVLGVFINRYYKRISTKRANQRKSHGLDTD